MFRRSKTKAAFQTPEKLGKKKLIIFCFQADDTTRRYYEIV
jgi:hypothetical protein